MLRESLYVCRISREAHETLKFDRWKSKGHLFCITSSFVNRFVAICQLKLELRSGNALIGAKFVLTSVTLTFDLLPWPVISLISMLITPESFMMVWWLNIVQKVWRTDGQTDQRKCHCAHILSDLMTLDKCLENRYFMHIAFKIPTNLLSRFL